MIDISGHLRNFKKDSGFLDKDNYITVNCCGYQKFITLDYVIQREMGRLDYQLIYITKGKGTIYLKDEEKELQEGNIIIYKPLEKQYYKYNHLDLPEHYWIHFTGFGVESLLSKINLTQKMCYHIGIDNDIIELYKKIIYELQIKRVSYENMANSYFIELISKISRRVIEISAGDKYKKNYNIQKTIEIMHSKYFEKYSVNDFATICNLSKYRFIHNFKDLTGLSPIQYLTEIRINKAKELLISSNLDIGEISDIVGYDNQLYFSRIFKKVTGFSPSYYRNSIL